MESLDCLALHGALYSIEKEIQKNAGTFSNNINVDDHDRNFSVSVQKKPAKIEAKEVCSGMEDKESFHTFHFIPADKPKSSD